MADWAQGYTTDIHYTYGYYRELNPALARFVLLSRGLAFPDVGNACELGFGQGLSLNLHAAGASSTQWCGTDFLPSQAAFAQELARASGAGPRLYEEAFADFAQRCDLPDFDFIGLHGIWSWIDDANRAVIVDFIRRRLKPGGVVYISYNTLPGWAAFAPVRHLMHTQASVLGVPGQGIACQVEGAIEFMQGLLATNPAFSQANPGVAEKVQQLKTLDRNYLAHEYFNRNWNPMHFATLADWLGDAKLQYAASANCLDHVPAIHLTQQQQEFLQQIPDVMFRETVSDFMVNRQFRKDYWVKGARRLDIVEQSERLKAQRVVLTTPRSDVSLRLLSARGEVGLNDEIYVPLLDLLAGHRVCALGDIELALRDRKLSFAQVLEAVMVLVGSGYLAPVQDEHAIAQARESTRRLNAHLCRKARGSNDVAYLASPVTGGGVLVTRFEQLFLVSLKNGGAKPVDWALAVWEVLSAQGQMLIKDGKPMASAEDSLAELTSQAVEFAAKRLPMLKALEVA